WDRTTNACVAIVVAGRDRSVFRGQAAADIDDAVNPARERVQHVVDAGNQDRIRLCRVHAGAGGDRQGRRVGAAPDNVTAAASAAVEQIILLWDRAGEKGARVR